MKHIVYLTFVIVLISCFSGCISKEGYDESFTKQYRRLERETKNFTHEEFYETDKRTADDKLSMAPGDRFATVQIEAQKERRAANKVVGSNYYFEVYPDRKETYSYNQYNEVWSDAYPQKSYKENNPDIHFTILNPKDSKLFALPIPEYRFSNIIDIVKKYDAYVGLDISNIDMDSFENEFTRKIDDYAPYISVIYLSDKTKD